MAFLLTGQTDSSKSTISGHILYRCGYFDTLPPEDRRTYDKYLTGIENNPSKSRWSILMDLLDGEVLANKTKTKEFNMCNFSYKDTALTLIDTPGHQLYIRNLLEALFHLDLDVVCLVISSIPSEFSESFQRGTAKEDLMLARSIGCKSLIVLWSKVDVSIPSEEMKAALQYFIKQLGFTSVDQVFISGLRGDGTDEFLDLVASKVKKEKEGKNPSTSVSKSISGTRFLIKGMFFPSPVLVTPGLQCVMHANEVSAIAIKDETSTEVNPARTALEIEIELEKIRDFKTKKNIKIVPATLPVLFTLKTQKAVSLAPNLSKVVFRTKNMTIGFGTVQKMIE